MTTESAGAFRPTFSGKSGQSLDELRVATLLGPGCPPVSYTWLEPTAALGQAAVNIDRMTQILKSEDKLIINLSEIS